jgi:hypothetical protein
MDEESFYGKSGASGGNPGQRDRAMDQNNFFASLFDFSFRTFITTKFIRVVYGLCIFMAGLASLTVLAWALGSGSAGTVLVGLLLAPVVFFAYVIAARVGLEVVVVLFRIAKNTQVLAEAAKRRGSSTSTEEDPPQA